MEKLKLTKGFVITMLTGAVASIAGSIVGYKLEKAVFACFGGKNKEETMKKIDNGETFEVCRLFEKED